MAFAVRAAMSRASSLGVTALATTSRRPSHRFESLSVAGDLLCAACLAVVAVGAGSALLSRSARRTAPTPSRRWQGSLVCGAAWTVAAVLLAVAFRANRELGGSAVAVPILVAAASFLGVGVTWKMGSSKPSHDAREAARQMELVVALGIASILATCLVEWALVERIEGITIERALATADGTRSSVAFLEAAKLASHRAFGW
jgi:cytochrome bd-type quinol oxidase subunit 2